jgi:DNA-directed RNA polymerase sigma subunit (sigma70/sigma32)
MTPIEISLAISLYNSGKTLEEVGDILDYNHTTIWYNIKTKVIMRPKGCPKGSRNIKRYLTIKTLRDSGLTLREIGEKLHLSKQRVYQILTQEQQ